MPVTVNSMAAIRAGQGLHSKVAEPQCGRLPALVSDGGPGDPLDDWTHKCHALAGGFSVQQPGVDRTRLVLQLGQVVQQAVAAQVLRVVDDGFDAQRDAVLQVLLQPGILVEHVEGDQVAVPVDLRLEPAAGGRDGRPSRWPRRNSSSTFSGRPRSMFSHSSASKNARAWTSSSKTRVREVSTCRIDSSHQYPASRSAPVSGSGILAIQRSNHTCTVPGPKRSQICCSPAGSSQVANPLDSSVKPIPAASACRLAHSCPLTHALTG